MCKCKKRTPVVDEFWTDFCVSCGRIWVNEFTGEPRRTERFVPISKPMGGVWIGHTFIRDKTGQLAKVLRHHET